MHAHLLPFHFLCFVASLRELSGVLRAFWGGIRGNDLSKLKDNSRYPSRPDFSHIISTFDPPKNVQDNYGQVLQAYFMVCT